MKNPTPKKLSTRKKTLPPNREAIGDDEDAVRRHAIGVAVGQRQLWMSGPLPRPRLQSHNLLLGAVQAKTLRTPQWQRQNPTHQEGLQLRPGSPPTRLEKSPVGVSKRAARGRGEWQKDNGKEGKLEVE